MRAAFPSDVAHDRLCHVQAGVDVPRPPNGSERTSLLNSLLCEGLLATSRRTLEFLQHIMVTADLRELLVSISQKRLDLSVTFLVINLDEQMCMYSLVPPPHRGMKVTTPGLDQSATTICNYCTVLLPSWLFLRRVQQDPRYSLHLCFLFVSVECFQVYQRLFETGFVLPPVVCCGTKDVFCLPEKDE